MLLLLVVGADRVAAAGLSVNGGAEQNGVVIGRASGGGDKVVGSGVFTGAFSQNTGNLGVPEQIAINLGASITSPGSQPFRTNSSTFTGSDGLTYTQNICHQAIISVSAGTLTNNGAIYYTSSTLPSSTYLYSLDIFVTGGSDAPGLGNTNRNYFWGDGIYVFQGNIQWFGGPISVVNGSANNTNAIISSAVSGGSQAFASGINAYGQYNNVSTNPDITVANYGTISGSYAGSYNGVAAGIYANTLYGGVNITNSGSSTVTACAPYYGVAIAASSYYGNVNVVENGVATATGTGGNQDNTSGLGVVVGIDLFTYANSSTPGAGNINLLTTGTTTGVAYGNTNATAFGVFCWAEGGSFTYTNTGTLSATGSCSTTAGATATASALYGGCDNGDVTLVNSGTVTGTAPNGGWAYGTENDTGNSIYINNSGTISHNTGLGVFIYGSAGGVATVTNSGSIYGGNEGIAAENYTGQLTIYDTGPVMGSSPNNNAMDLGSGNDTVHLYGLPNIVGWMNGQGGSNVLDLELVGTLQKVNGASPMLGNNLAAYNFNPTTGNSIVVSGQTYKWSNFYVTGSVTAPPTLTATLVNNGTVAKINWPATFTGWTLQFQTNSLAVGLSTNWQDVAGSTATNQMQLPLSMTNGCVFYRLLLQ